jgi:hypothetical protein
MVEKPNYVALFVEIASTTDATLRAELIASAYTFVSPLTEDEKTLFDYCISGYIEKNPGIVGNAYSSYVGVYINDNGEVTG